MDPTSNSSIPKPGQLNRRSAGETQRAPFRRGLALLGLGTALFAVPSYAQRANENVVTASDDAFGSQLGRDQTGIYTPDDIRGFSAVKAGNTRLEGVYYDQFAGFQRTIRGTTVRVGTAALDFPFPAPTGIVDRTLKVPGTEPRASVYLARAPYGAIWVEAETEFPLIKDRWSLGITGSYEETEFVDGAGLKAVTSGAITRYKHATGEVLGFVDYYETWDSTPQIVTVASGPFLPSLPKARVYRGQSWAKAKTNALNFGGIVRQRISDNLSFRGGMFLSAMGKPNGFSEIVRVGAPNGSATHLVIADPDQTGRSISGEAQLAWTGGDDQLRHRVYLMARGRDRRTESGGSDVIDLGPINLGDLDPEPEPAFDFGTVDVGRVRHFTGGIGYVGKLAGIGQVNFGLQKTSYRAAFTHLNSVARSSDSPWLYNASVAVNPLSWLEVYGSYVTGLEESGVAPENAANRNELLPASRTRQIDGGVRLTAQGWKFAASGFDITKPYFSFDDLNRFAAVGDVRHRGVEFSLTKRFGTRLNLLAGAVLMDPVVSGPVRDTGRIGDRAVGISKTQLRLDADYSTPLKGLSFNGSVVHTGKRAASARPYAELGGEQLDVPAYTRVDIGGRYNFKAGDASLSLRANVMNVFDARGWNIVAANTYLVRDVRRLRLQIVADF
ncbi:TonB-dependent receptor domain-containing protein [Sphingopyxis granuli]|uniref:TonB-dependent receptor domain-containing protein n=1 Tax=Sphingopyxis granuli TaxID=267128 RepID=UPI00301BC130